VIDTVALVGDSIRISYQPYVAMRLRTQFTWGPADNCQSSRFLLANLDRLVFAHLHDRTLIHFNAGAHDIRRIEEDRYEVQVPLGEYRLNLAAIIERMASHPLVVGVVASTTTPVDDIRHKTKQSVRYNEDVIAYNEALVDVAAAARCYIDDLYEELRRCRFDPLSADGIHLNEPGKEYAGSRVAAYVRGLLA